MRRSHSLIDYMKLFLILFTSLFVLFNVVSINKSLPYYGMTIVTNIKRLKDGNSLLIGYTNILYRKDKDIFVIKMNQDGKVIWAKVLRTVNDDLVYDAIEVPDGYLLVGYTSSFGVGGYDGLVVKLDENGNLIWAKTIGGKGYDGIYAIKKVGSAYLLAGFSSSSRESDYDGLVVKLDENGNLIWAKTIGGKGYDDTFNNIVTSNSNIFLIGSTWSFNVSMDDVFMVKLDENGNLIWAKTIGGAKYDDAHSALVTRKGKIIVAGSTWSFGYGLDDGFVIKMNQDGKVIWAKVLGGGKYDGIHDAIEVPDGYLLVGYTSSFGVGGYDGLVVKLDENGNLIWAKTIGGKGYDTLMKVRELPQGYLLVGYTSSFSKEYAALLVSMNNYGEVLSSRILYPLSSKKEGSVKLISFAKSIKNTIGNGKGNLIKSVNIKAKNQLPNIGNQNLLIKKEKIQEISASFISQKVVLKETTPRRVFNIYKAIIDWMLDNFAILVLILPVIIFVLIMIIIAIRSRGGRH